ncbi:MAG: hypothetical protein JRD93_10120, partial [Deltaproteobacteria bacterium]|nr:hypothetical protein [Deltaproteobacteria bacterium]
TVNGLGLGGSPNIELNMEVTDDRDRTDLLNWFEEIWNDNTGNSHRSLTVNPEL